MKEKLSWEEWIETFEPREAEWARAKPKCKGYPRDWATFKDWLSDRIPKYFPELKGQLDITASDILRLRALDMEKHRDDPARWRFEKTAKDFYESLYRDKDYPSGVDRNKLIAIQSFFSYHRMALVFRRGELDKPVYEKNYYEYKLVDLEAAKKYGDRKEKWIYLGGKSIGQRIGDFRKLRVDHIEPYLEDEPPVPLRLPTSKKNVVAHPCLDADALEAARDLIRSRDPNDPNPYMLAGYKGEPMKGASIREAIKRVAKVAHRADLDTFKVKSNESLRFHNFRVFLSAGLQNAGTNQDLIDYIVGHELGDTKRAYTSKQIGDAYRKAEKYLLLPRPRTDLTLSTEQEEKVKALIKVGMLRRSARISESEDAEPRRRVVEEEKLENELNHGWRFVSVLPSGKILIEREV